jgi:HlyD family secretion protein
MRASSLPALFLACVALSGCEPVEKSTEFRRGEVLERDITVTVEAAGIVRPFLTVDVKSKASGEILSMHAETGDVVEEGALLVQVDERMPRNQLALVQSQLDAAKARLAIAEAQKTRAERLLQSRSINQVDYENASLELASARAELIRSQISIDNARFALDDTEVNAPISGTVIEKLVERGQVISSPVMDVGEGTVLIRMADLSRVQVQALVNELDIGRVAPDQTVTVRAAAYPDMQFVGKVLKIEPQAVAEQAITMFPVIMALENDNGVLRPGMNATVEIFVEQREDILTVPASALRTSGDIPVTASLMGVNEAELRAAISSAEGARPPKPDTTSGDKTADGHSTYWVLVPVDSGFQPRIVETSTLTDHAFSEVLSGLSSGTEVLLLPSSGLVESQQRLQRALQQRSNLAELRRGD